MRCSLNKQQECEKQILVVVKKNPLRLFSPTRKENRNCSEGVITDGFL